MKKIKNKSGYRIRRHARIRSKMEGSSNRPRLVVYRSLKFTYAQLVDDQSRRVLMSLNDQKIKKGSKVDRSKEVGKALAKKALQAGITACVFDRNGFKYHGRVKAVAEGAREAGLKF